MRDKRKGQKERREGRKKRGAEKKEMAEERGKGERMPSNTNYDKREERQNFNMTAALPTPPTSGMQRDLQEQALPLPPTHLHPTHSFAFCA
jgi:hypothetical protein